MFNNDQQKTTFQTENKHFSPEDRGILWADLSME